MGATLTPCLAHLIAHLLSTPKQTQRKGEGGWGETIPTFFNRQLEQGRPCKKHGACQTSGKKEEEEGWGLFRHEAQVKTSGYHSQVSLKKNAFSLSHSRSLSLGMLSVVNSITTRAIAYTILHRSLVYW